MRLRPLCLALPLIALGCTRPESATCPAAPTGPYPAPRFLSADPSSARRACTVAFEDGALAEHATLDGLLPEVLAEEGRSAAQQHAAWTIELVAAPPALPADASAAWSAAGDNPERYIVSTTAGTDGLHSELYATSERAALFALRVALSLPEAATVVDWPSFPVRGMIEGFYGTPFSNDDRLATIRLMSRLRQNTYLYGPKDDEYARASWAEPYPSDRAAEIAAAAAEASSHLVDFIWSVSPGWGATQPSSAGSISYSSDQDFQRLTAKIESVRALGVEHFALFLDDVRPELVWDADKAAFPSLAAAHQSLMNRLEEYLRSRDPNARLLTVGTAYAGDITGWQSYNQILGQGLRPDIDVLWTGPQTFSSEMQATDMTEIDGLLGRPVEIWDNWPVEVAPLDGRSADLPTTVGGFLSNTILSMYGHAVRDTWTVMGPIADYTWQPAAYSPAQSSSRWQMLGGY